MDTSTRTLTLKDRLAHVWHMESDWYCRSLCMGRDIVVASAAACAAAAVLVVRSGVVVVVAVVAAVYRDIDVGVGPAASGVAVFSC